MIAVSNASPLIILARSKYLENVQKIFKHVIIPEAVFNEIFQKKDVSSKTVRELINVGLLTTPYVKKLARSFLIIFPHLLHKGLRPLSISPISSAVFSK